MISILTNTDVILETQVSPQHPSRSDAMVTSILALKLKRHLSDSIFQEQESYLDAASIAAFSALNRLDQSNKFRASLNLVPINREPFNFSEGSSSAGLGYALALFLSWWTVALKKPSRLTLPVFTTGAMLKSGKVKKIGHLNQKIESLCKFADSNRQDINAFYFCYPEENEPELDAQSKKKLTDRGAILVSAGSIQGFLIELLGNDYDGAPLGRWEPFKSGPFEYEDNLRYFGRSQEIDGIVDLLKRDKSIVVSGCANSGKTSIINAGVIPRLEQEKELSWCRVRPEDFANNENPTGHLIKMICESWSLGLEASKVEGLEQLFEYSIFQGLIKLSEILNTKERRYLLVIDQIERMLTRGNLVDQNNIEVLNLISEFSRVLSDVYIIVSIRHGYLESFSKTGLLQDFQRYELETRVSQSDWVLIIQDQAAFSGVNYESDGGNVRSLDKLILDDVTHSSVSIGLAERFLGALYGEAVHDSETGSIIKYRDYEKIGGAEGYMLQEASKILTSIDNEKDLNSFFDLFFSQDQDYRPYARVVGFSDLYASAQPVIDIAESFIDRGFITSSDQGFKFAFKFLIDKWKDLDLWLARSKGYLRWRYSFERDYLDWKSGYSRTSKPNLIDIINVQKNRIINEDSSYIRQMENAFENKYGHSHYDLLPKNSMYLNFIRGWDETFQKTESTEYLIEGLKHNLTAFLFLKNGFIGEQAFTDYVVISNTNYTRKMIGRALVLTALVLLIF